MRMEKEKMKKIWYKRLVAICLIMVCMLSVSSNVYANEESDNGTTGMEFISKSVETGETTVYTISKETVRSGEMVQPSYKGTAPDDRKIIGSDNRIRVTSTTSFPYRAIAYLESYWPDGTTTIGTAWMISLDAAATAGHCVYDSERGGWADNITIWPGYNDGTAPYGSATVTTMHTSTNYISSEDRNYDYGVLELKTSIGNTVGYFGFRWQSASYTGSSATVTGYPGKSLQGQMWKMAGNITSCTSTRLEYQIDTTGGQSGSPVYYYTSDSGYVAIGIHTAEYLNKDYNLGTRITEYMYNFFNEFR